MPIYRNMVLAAVTLVLLAISACTAQCGKNISSEQVSDSFINKVWQVSKSEAIVPGTLYTFLADGTLVITSTGNKPGIGRWQMNGDKLSVTEAGLTYPVDMQLSDDTLILGYHNPAGITEITLVRADK